MSNLRKPPWLRVKKEDMSKLKEVNQLIDSLNLNTVCKEANCPNRLECFGKKTATFMILGNVCTRNCKFCNVTGGKPQNVDLDEPKKIAMAISKLGLMHAVITSVTRDDLPDGGSNQFHNVIKEIRAINPDIVIEVLIPDFKGDSNALFHVLDAKPNILNHNVETVKNIYKDIRPEANYIQSLMVLKNSKKYNPKIYTKSGIMVGVGEKKEEVLELFKDLVEHSCDFLTIGQYLSPSSEHFPVKEYIHPDTFKFYKDAALKEGLKYVASDPLVRSSYNAKDFFESLKETPSSN